MDRQNVTLALGHAASGKSAWAEAEVRRIGGDRVYVATAQLWDEEMRAKAVAHARARGPDWHVIEEPIELAATCRTAKAGQIWLVDCATMWLTNIVLADAPWEGPAADWIDAMADSPAKFVVVSNDVGGGITPDNALARRFQTAQGRLNQRLAHAAGRVVLVTAGLPQVLK
ncbi:MAG: bifunctional adenosylcobinamide kinase/adenosylcobinamide-phosphate guanylyltransferase [Pseudomonadota bacterium]